MTTPPDPWIPIRTERLLLRDFREADFDAVHAYGSDPEVTRYMSWGPNSEEDTRGALDRALASQAASPRGDFNLAVEHAATGVVIGSIGLHPFDEANRTREIGYCLHRAWWRQGFAHEAARALIDASVAALDLHRIVATCDVRNAGSFGVMEKLGMRREGHFRRDRQIRSEWRDTYLYAILAEDWRPCCKSVRENIDR